MFGRKRALLLLAQARTAEIRGELAQAAALYAQAGRLDEAARVMMMRGDAESDPRRRLEHYVQAAATARMLPEAHAVRDAARAKRAALVVAMARDCVTAEPSLRPAMRPMPAMTEAMRADVVEAARELEAIGAPEQAAEAYALAGDEEGQARALAQAGEPDKLEWVLSMQQARDRTERARREAHEQFAMLVASGRRRDACALARASDDASLGERARGIEDKRVSGACVRVGLRGRAMAIVLGDEVIVGRTAAIAIASPAVSREHVAIARRGATVVLRDLASRNGTTLRGLAISGEVPAGEGIEVELGGEVPLAVRPSGEMQGAAEIECAGQRWIAPLGEARLGVGRWTLSRGSDDWVTLVTHADPPAYAGGVQLADEVQLLRKDEIASARGGEIALSFS